DGVETAVSTGLDPGDVVAHRPYLPAFETLRRDQHGEVGLATGAGEGAGDVVFLALRVFHADDHHVFGHPALVARHHGGDAQRHALLAEQRVATVAGTVGDDLAGFREVHDVAIVWITGPGNVGAAIERVTHRVQALDEGLLAQDVEYAVADARHDAHAHHHVGRIGQLHADLGDVRAQRAHAEGNDIHRATSHAAFEQALELCAHGIRLVPVVGRAGVFLVFGADEGAVFDASDVAGIRAGEETAGAELGVELDEGACFDKFVAQAVVFFLAAVTPVDVLRLAQFGNFFDPVQQCSVASSLFVRVHSEIGRASCRDRVAV